MDPTVVDGYVLPVIRYILTDAVADVTIMTYSWIPIAACCLVTGWMLYDIWALFTGGKTPPFVNAAREYERNGGHVLGAMKHAMWMDLQWQFRFFRGVPR